MFISKAELQNLWRAIRDLQLENRKLEWVLKDCCKHKATEEVKYSSGLVVKSCLNCGKRLK